jgi:hypothetical protein
LEGWGQEEGAVGEGSGGRRRLRSSQTAGRHRGCRFLTSRLRCPSRRPSARHSRRRSRWRKLAKAGAPPLHLALRASQSLPEYGQGRSGTRSARAAHFAVPARVRPGSLGDSLCTCCALRSPCPSTARVARGLALHVLARLSRVRLPAARAGRRTREKKTGWAREGPGSFPAGSQGQSPLLLAMVRPRPPRRCSGRCRGP